MKIAIQGIAGCFHHIAANDYFTAANIEIMECPNFKVTAAQVIAGQADAGVMAIENSIAGSILPNYDILQNEGLKVVGEINSRIRQNLLVMQDVSIEDIREVQSHPMALLQCADFLDNYPQWKQVSTQDTAFSARHVAQKKLRNTAAIAGDLPADLWGLKIIAPEINTIKNNYTRFLVLARADDSRFDSDLVNKASLYFKVSHTQGSLNKVLKSMELYEMNMTKLQSYPIPSDPFRYMFHLDMEFANTEHYQAAIALMAHHSEELRVYGEYKKFVEQTNQP